MFPYYTPQDVARFWKKVNKTEGCWNWTAGVLKGAFPYGRFMLNKRKYLAHRLAYFFTQGFIPDDVDVLHKCDNPRCCNPDHLFLGTDIDNSRDCVAKGRHAYGERSGQARLSAGDVRDLRELYAIGMSFARLAPLYGVNEATVRSAVRGDTWKHVA